MSDGREEREEREVRLSVEQFDALWPATAGHRLTKVRYDVPWKKHIIEIDVYRGRHDGLVVAEVEFDDQKIDPKIDCRHGGVRPALSVTGLPSPVNRRAGNERRRTVEENIHGRDA